jgi:hypothetical protein
MFFKIDLPTTNPFVILLFELGRRILKHGFPCLETSCIDRVWQFLSLDEYCLYLIKKRWSHHKFKKWVLHNFLLKSQRLQRFTTFIISNPLYLGAFTPTYSIQIIVQDFDASSTCFQARFFTIIQTSI